MKKLLSIIVLSTFMINQIAMASPAQSASSRLAKILIEKKINAQNAEEVKLLTTEMLGELNKAKIMLSEMPDEEFENLKNIEIEAAKNDTSANLQSLSLNEAERNMILSEIDEETLSLASSTDEAIEIALNADFKVMKNAYIQKLKTLSKGELVKKIKSVDEKAKNTVENLLAVATIVAVLAVAFLASPFLPAWGAILVIVGILGANVGIKYLLWKFTHLMDEA